MMIQEFIYKAFHCDLLSTIGLRDTWFVLFNIRFRSVVIAKMRSRAVYSITIQFRYFSSFRSIPNLYSGAHLKRRTVARSRAKKQNKQKAPMSFKCRPPPYRARDSPFRIIYVSKCRVKPLLYTWFQEASQLNKTILFIYCIHVLYMYTLCITYFFSPFL